MRSGPRVWAPAAAIVFAFVAVSGAHPGHAAKVDVVKAREHARKGDALLKLEKYGEALEEFEAAYVGDSEPTALFNIARCHELLGETDAAARFYHRYLDEAPHGRLRPYAQKRIAALEHPVLVPLVEPAVAASPPAKPAPPAAPAPVKPVATAPVKPAPTVATAPVKPAPAVATAPTKPAPAPAPAPAKPTVAAAPAPAKPAPRTSAPPAGPSNGGYAPIGEPQLAKASEVKPAPAPAAAPAPAPVRVSLAPRSPPAAAPPAQAVLVTSPAPTKKSDAKDQGSHRSHWWLWALLAVGVSAGAAAYFITQRSSSAAAEPPCPAPRMCQ